jgi:thiamine kinase-like enzyme
VGDLTAIVDRLATSLGATEGDAVALDGGITNRNFRVRFGGCDYVVRLPGKDTQLLGISRESERRANRAAAELGIAPAVAASDEECLVTEFVQATTMEPPDVRIAAEAVGRALRDFHDSGTHLPSVFWVPNLLEQYARIVGDVPPVYETTVAIAGRIAEALPLAAPAPCHNDLLPANLMRTESGAVMLVDWEYAGMGHRLFDLGNVAVNNEFGPEDEERLLSAYFDRPPAAGERAALSLMRIMSDAREAAWGVIQSAISELEFDFDSYARKHFDRLLSTARDPRLEEWLVAASA